MRRIPALVAASLVLALAGCHPAHEPHPLEPGTPIFASKEAAVAEARAAFARYVAASSRMGMSGGVDMSGYEGVVLEDLLADEQLEADHIHEAGHRIEGDLTTFGWDLKDYVDDEGESALHARLCIDLSAIHVFDEHGTDLTAASHVNALPYDAFFLTQERKPYYFVNEVNQWEGEDFCLSDSVPD